MKAYPIVQLAKPVGPQPPQSWPAPLDPAVAAWREETAHLPQAGNQIYLHVPFCPHLCGFCPLYKSQERTEDLKQAFIRAIIQEIELYGTIPSVAGQVFNTVYIGGGTGSELTPEQMGQIFAALRQNFKITDDAEITLEGVAKQMVAPEFMARSLEYGANRISFGVESLEPNLRKRIGRGDNIADYVKLVELCRALDPKMMINAETMAALPEQTLASVEYDVREMISWGLNSADVFYYVMMAGTKLEKLVTSGRRAEPRYGARMLEMRDLVTELFHDSGYRPVTGEVFSRDDRDLFTLTSFGGGGNCLNTVLALGPSGFGAVGGTVYQNVCDLKAYVEQLGRGLLPVYTASTLDLATAKRRARILSVLRLEVPDALFGGYWEQRRIERWKRLGLLDPVVGGYKLSRRGVLWYNHMQMELLPLPYLVKAAAAMFGSVENQKDKQGDQDLTDTQAHELRQMFATHGKAGTLAFDAFMAAKRLPFFDSRPVGFTGVVES